MRISRKGTRWFLFIFKNKKQQEEKREYIIKVKTVNNEVTCWYLYNLCTGVRRIYQYR